MSRTSLRLLWALFAVAATARASAQDAPQSAMEAVYARSQEAKSIEDFTAMIDECRRLLETNLSPQHQAYLKQLASWAHNRRGELRADRAAELRGADEEAAAQLDAEALEDFQAAIELDPTRWKAHHNRGVSYAQAGEYDKALADFEQALRFRPNYANAWFNRGEIHYEQGKFAQAISDYNNVLRTNPDDADAYTRRGHAYFKLGRYREALRDYTRAVELRPDDPLALLNRGEAYLSLSQWDQAARDYRRAVELDGTLARGYQGAAWLMAVCPDPRYQYPDRAVNAALKAIELAGEGADYRYYDTLAAAYAAGGDFAKAQEAIAAALAQAPPEKADDLKQRQALYQQNRPYRLP